MKIGLIQIDGKMPNLALMKLSKWHKERGDDVQLNNPNQAYDKVYISCIFEENRSQALGLTTLHENAVAGGYGISDMKLPEEIEHIMPDYSLYDCDYSLGFTTRGCIRNCSWCIVPKMEGMIRENCNIYEFWSPSHKKIVLYDNNILALPKHFKKIANQISKENLYVDFNQGLDIRLLTDEFAEILSQLKIRPDIRFAFDTPEITFDTPEIKEDVVKGIQILNKHGIKRAMWYVLVGFNTTIEQDLKRLKLLKKYNQTPFVMRYKTTKGNPIYSHLASWANQQRFFKSISFEKMVQIRENRGVMI